MAADTDLPERSRSRDDRTRTTILVRGPGLDQQNSEVQARERPSNTSGRADRTGADRRRTEVGEGPHAVAKPKSRSQESHLRDRRRLRPISDLQKRARSLADRIRNPEDDRARPAWRDTPKSRGFRSRDPDRTRTANPGNPEQETLAQEVARSKNTIELRRSHSCGRSRLAHHARELAENDRRRRRDIQRTTVARTRDARRRRRRAEPLGRRQHVKPQQESSSSRSRRALPTIIIVVVYRTRIPYRRSFQS